jgi:hypothetical protein
MLQVVAVSHVTFVMGVAGCFRVSPHSPRDFRQARQQQ